MKNKNVAEVKTENELLLTLGAKLQIEIEGIALRFVSTLIGVDPKKCMIIRTPSAPADFDLKGALFSGREMIIRYLHEGRVFGFKSRLLGAASAPSELLFIEYPQKTEHYDLRLKKRIQCFIPAKIKIDGQEILAAIVDISESGCRCLIKPVEDKLWEESLPSFQKDAILEMICQFPDEDIEQAFNVTIKNVIEEERKISLGLSFDTIDGEGRGVITRYVLYATKFGY